MRAGSVKQSSELHRPFSTALNPPCSRSDRSDPTSLPLPYRSNPFDPPLHNPSPTRACHSGRPLGPAALSPLPGPSAAPLPRPVLGPGGTAGPRHLPAARAAARRPKPRLGGDLPAGRLAGRGADESLHGCSEGSRREEKRRSKRRGKRGSERAMSPHARTLSPRPGRAPAAAGGAGKGQSYRSPLRGGRHSRLGAGARREGGRKAGSATAAPRAGTDTPPELRLVDRALLPAGARGQSSGWLRSCPLPSHRPVRGWGRTRSRFHVSARDKHKHGRPRRPRTGRAPAGGWRLLRGVPAALSPQPTAAGEAVTPLPAGPAAP